MAHAGQHSAKALGQGHQGSEFRRDREIFMKVLVLGGERNASRPSMKLLSVGRPERGGLRHRY
jgi:hypothetical protein